MTFSEDIFALNEQKSFVENKGHIKCLLDIISRQISSDIEYPNAGGCAVIAAIVGSELSKITDVEVIVTNGWCGNVNITEIKNNHDTSNFADATHWHKVGVHFSHVVLKVKIDQEWMVYDSDGLREYNSDQYCEGTLTIKEASAIASAAAGWNVLFDRCQIPSIIDIVCKAFNVSALTNMSGVKFDQ